NEPRGLYFPGLGKYDLTGDGYDDIILIDVSESIPLPEDKEVNGLGVTLIYYRAGLQDSDAGVYLENGSSGNIEGIKERGTFLEPKYYYRPIPETQVLLNPNLEQIFDWD
ncbi:MAG: RagB/SusD family nutrient uptake outer membrane protein, partial [Eudoraea sp.]|nr:RagB/SusD family nutrient uptake outer membrane protein [Eudoraea sp.]